MNIKISIFADQRDPILNNIFGTTLVEDETNTELNDNVDIQFKGSISMKGMHDIVASHFLDFIVSFSSGVGAGIVANSLYNKLSNANVTKIIINSKPVELTIKGIEKAIEIEINDKS